MDWYKDSIVIEIWVKRENLPRETNAKIFQATIDFIYLKLIQTMY